MFLVPTYLAPSRIHGFGVFTPIRISAGTILCAPDPAVDWELTAAELDTLPEPLQTRMRKHCYLDERGIYVFCGDNARFMNHSDTPNCDDEGTHTVARRDIEVGEELTCDYRAFDQHSARGEWDPGMGTKTAARRNGHRPGNIVGI